MDASPPRGARREEARARALAEQQLRILLESTRDRVYTVDTALRITGVFGTWLAEEGRSPEELVGRPLLDTVPPDERAVHEAAWRRALDGDGLAYEYARVEGARTTYMQASLSPMRDPERAVVGAVGVARDISDLRQLQAQLVMSDRLVSLGTLAAGVAHEINNPLACILANVGAALEDLEGGAPRDDLRETLEDVQLAARRVRDIVADLRQFSHPPSRELAPIDVNAVLDSSVRLAWNELRERARVEKQYGAVSTVLVSGSRLGQAFVNLLVNAAQAIPSGSPESNVVTVRTREERGAVVVEIADTGSGMTEETKGRLFTPFFTTKPPGVGTGLGLSIAHRTISDLGGIIEVESCVGRGSTFRIRLSPAG